MRLPAQLIAAVLVLAACASSNSDVQRFRATFVPDGFQIMTGTEGELVLTQCSHYAPQASGFWQPAAADIHQLERRLPAYLARQQKHLQPSSETTYYRHYVGVVHDGRRYIYLNAFPVESVKSDHELYLELKAKNHPALEAMQPWMAEPDFWRRHSMMVCDGGNFYWGVEYDPLTKQFLNLSCNGEA